MQGGGGGRTARIKAAQRQAAQISGHKRFMAGGNAEWLPKIKEMRLLEARPWKEIVAATYGGAKKAWSDKVRSTLVGRRCYYYYCWTGRLLAPATTALPPTCYHYISTTTT